MVDVSIGIVTYNNEKKILNILGDIYEHLQGLNFKVYVLDNQSKDNTVDRVKDNFPQVEIVQNTANTGFGNGHNIILRRVSSRYHLILNPDIRLLDNPLGELVAYMDTHTEVSMVTPKILNPDGTEQELPKLNPSFKYLLSGRLAPFSRFFANIRREYTMANKNITEPTEIEFCTGCFMLGRTDILKQLGGFDERFFMYLEDAELSQRMAKHGKVMFYPAVSVIHEWERSSAKNPKFFLIHVQSMFKFLAMKKK